MIKLVIKVTYFHIISIMTLENSNTNVFKTNAYCLRKKHKLLVRHKWLYVKDQRRMQQLRLRFHQNMIPIFLTFDNLINYVEERVISLYQPIIIEKVIKSWVFTIYVMRQ